MGKVAFREGGGHAQGTAVAAVQRHTFGKYAPLAQSPLIGTGVTPCDTTGEAASFIFNDTVAAGDGVGLMTRYTGADAIRVLAAGPVPANAEVYVKVVNGHPKADDVANGTSGYIVVGRVNFGNSATAEDVADVDGNFDPSLTITLYDDATQRQITE